MNRATHGGKKLLKGLLRGRKTADTDGEFCNFLSRISEEIPEFYHCAICDRLHLWRKVAQPGPFPFSCICPLASVPPSYSDSLVAVWKLSGTQYVLDACHVQLSIGRHLRGPGYGMAAESLSYTGVKVPEFQVKYNYPPEISTFFRHHAITVTSVDACVSPNPASLCLRVQSLQIGHEKFLQGSNKKDAATSWGTWIRRNQRDHLRCLPRKFENCESGAIIARAHDISTNSRVVGMQFFRHMQGLPEVL